MMYIEDANIELKLENFLKYMKRQSFHHYVKQKMVNRFKELFEEELLLLKNDKKSI